MLDRSPDANRELRGQLATYDVVGPRLAVLFETMDRTLQGEPVGHDPDESRAATAPFPGWLDRDPYRRSTPSGMSHRYRDRNWLRSVSSSSTDHLPFFHIPDKCTLHSGGSTYPW